MKNRALLSIVLVGVLIAGCNQRKSAKDVAQQDTAEASTNRQVFEVHGVVKGVKPAEKTVVIKHEDIKDFMPGMTMPFEVNDTNILTGLKPGDAVIFRLNVTDTAAWIDQIRVTGETTNSPPATNQIPPNASIRRVRDVDPLALGDKLPAYSFTNQFGQPFSTAQFKGQALTINFLFTRCPFPTFCPLMANHFREVQTKLAAATGGPTNWHLLTISFDPQFDTPTVLNSYAQAHGCNPAHWTFATGDLSEITALADQLGEMFARDETGSISHNLRTAVFGASGRLQKIFPGNEWSPDELVAEVVQAAEVN